MFSHLKLYWQQSSKKFTVVYFVITITHRGLFFTTGFLISL